MIINPNKKNENLVVLMTIEIIAFLFFISSDSVSAILIWFLTISILNSIAVYLLIKHTKILQDFCNNNALFTRFYNTIYYNFGNCFYTIVQPH